MKFIKNMEENLRKVSSKKSIISLICGIVAVFFPYLWIVIAQYGLSFKFLSIIEQFIRNNTSFFYAQVYKLILLIMTYIAPGVFGIILGIIGLIFGIKGLKSLNKKTAIFGIILCIIGILFWAYQDLVFYAMWSYHNNWKW